MLFQQIWWIVLSGTRVLWNVAIEMVELPRVTAGIVAQEHGEMLELVQRQR